MLGDAWYGFGSRPLRHMLNTAAAMLRHIVQVLIWGTVACGFAEPSIAEQYFEIQVIDKETRRGVPMVELTTVDDVVYITDSSGRVAFE